MIIVYEDTVICKKGKVMERDFIIDKEEDNDSYTVVKNIFIRNKDIRNSSLMLLVKMLSLPPDWDYSFEGLVKICKDGKSAIRNQLNELKVHGFVEINQYRNKKGQIQYKYIVHRKSTLKEPKNINKPTPGFQVTAKPSTVNRTQINTYNKDIKDKIDKTIEHSIFTKELIRQNYISEDDISSFYFDDLFNEYLKANYSYGEIFRLINYIVPKVLSRNFMDEYGNEIVNKYAYFKSSIESNIEKLNNNLNELYPDDPNNSFWNDYKNIIKDRER